MIFRHGNKVQAVREGASKGTWPRYANKIGTVRSINREADEIGVQFGQSHLTAWFRPSELRLIAATATPSRSSAPLLKLTT